MLRPLILSLPSAPEFQQPSFDAPSRRLDGSSLGNKYKVKSQVKNLEDKMKKNFQNAKQKTEMKHEGKRKAEDQVISPNLQHD